MDFSEVFFSFEGFFYKMDIFCSNSRMCNEDKRRIDIWMCGQLIFYIFYENLIQ